MSATELPTTFTYTGQREAAEIGLMYYVARWYDSEIGHFIQADTIVPGAGNAIAFNRFAYVKYNPIRYTDPSGHDDEPTSKKDLVEEWLKNPCTEDYHFCLLDSGGLIDHSHFNFNEANDLWKWLVDNFDQGKVNNIVGLTQSGTGFTFSSEYYVNFTNIDSIETLARVAVSIWRDFQLDFEAFQSQAYPLGVGNITAFSSPDISSAHLAMVSAITGYGYDNIVQILGGGWGYNFEWQFPITATRNKNHSTNLKNLFTGDLIKYPDELSITPFISPDIWGLYESPEWLSQGVWGIFIDDSE